MLFVRSYYTGITEEFMAIHAAGKTFHLSS